jgi:DNA polymerase III epsilon subunit-like protein
MSEVFISVDVEAAGPIPGEYSLTSIGACDVRSDDAAFECLVKPINGNFDRKAIEVAGLSLDDLERIGLPPAEAMEGFRRWIARTCGREGRPVFVGFNASFDWSFVNYYFHKYLGANPFGFAALDIKSLYMGATGCAWDETRSSRIASRLKPQLEGTHNALQDARYQAEMFRLIMKLK